MGCHPQDFWLVVLFSLVFVNSVHLGYTIWLDACLVTAEARLALFAFFRAAREFVTVVPHDACSTTKCSPTIATNVRNR